MDHKLEYIKILKPQSNYVKNNFQECRIDTKYSSDRLRQGMNVNILIGIWSLKQLIVRKHLLTSYPVRFLTEHRWFSLDQHSEMCTIKKINSVLSEVFLAFR